jgi:general secretion pathway protein C
MGLDAKLKRWFPLLLCALLALVAYLQASGIGELVAASVSQPSATPPVLAPLAPLEANGKSGEAILARNPFDSVTGPLDGKELAIPTAPTASAAPTLGQPAEDAPSCDFGRVVLITASDDPEWSFAAVEAGGPAVLRRTGDDVSGHTVLAMAYNRIWLEGNGKQCQMKLGDRSAQMTTAAGDPGQRIGRPRRGRIPEELAAKIHKVSDTEFNVERSVVDEILENQAELMRTARIVPDKQGDRVLGIRLFGIRSGTLLSTLGFQNGDRLESINGFEMSDPQKALEAYGRLRTADSLKVKINRGGTPVSIDFNIQ